MAGPWEDYAPAQAPLRITVRPKGAGGPWADYAPAPIGVAEDVAKSAGSGLVRGAAQVAGMGGDLQGWIFGKVEDRLRNAGVDLNRAREEMNAASPSFMRQEADAPRIGTKEIMAGVDRATGLPITSYQPQTTVGKFARTGAEFIPGAVLAPGGVVGNAVRYGIIPGIASEAAGQATEGTAYEPWARIGGGLAAAGGVAALSRPGTAAQSIRQQLPEGVTPQMVDDAARLIDDAAGQGVNLSWPEALSQVAGRPVLTNTLRHLEASPQTEARMAEFFGGRPGQVEAAARQQFDNVAPVNPSPSTIGPAVGQAAEGTLNDVRQTINRATDPFYQRAATVRLTPQEMAQVRALPGYAEAARAVRGDPQLNRYVANLPDDSVGFLNEVKKYLDQAAENATAPMAQNRNMQRGAGYTQDAAAARQIGINASPEYEIALQVQEQTRRQFLEPLLQGPLGKLAGKDKTTRDAINALFPQNPLPNSADEIATAVSALAQRNPRAARDLVRAHIESTFNQSAKDLQSGANAAGGAKFRAALVGNPQAAANLEAAVRALPHGDQVWPGFNRFLEILEATGTRQNVGSRTAYNAELLKDASASGIVGEGAKAATNPLRGLQFLADKYERWRLGRNMNELADILTNPAAVNQLRAIARMPANSPAALNVAVRLTMLTRSATTSGQNVPSTR